MLKQSDGLVPAALVSLSLVPSIADTVRLAEWIIRSRQASGHYARTGLQA